MRARGWPPSWRNGNLNSQAISRRWRNRQGSASLSGSQEAEGTLHLSPDLSRKPAAHNAGLAVLPADDAARLILSSLEDDKAEDIVTIDVRGKSSIADMLIIASGRSTRHVAALAEHLLRRLKDAGAEGVKVEGLSASEWVLIDAGDVIVHLFKPETRAFYNIERIWTPPAALAS